VDRAIEAPQEQAVSSRSTAAALAAVLVGATALRLAGAIWLPNVAWPDEIFQTLEQAHRLAFGYGVVPWEFRDGARSWLLPGALGGVMAASGWAGGLAHVRAVQVLLSALAVIPAAIAFLWSRERGRAAAVVAAVACAFWFDLVLFGPKALNEVVAAHVLVAGVYLSSEGRRPATLAWAGAVLALAVVLRIHLAPAVLAAAVVTARRDLARWRALALGAVPVIAAVGLLDLLTWGDLFHSYVTTVRTNVIEGRSRRYGTAEWHAYARMLWDAWSWSLLALVGLAAIGARRRPAAAIATVVILVAHSAIAHKEYRFIYPAVVLAVVLAGAGTADAVAWVVARTRARAWAVALAAALLWTGTSAAVTERSPKWSLGRSGLEATVQASAGSPCGLALIGQHWTSTGGYTYLRRDVPIYVIDDTDGLIAAWPGFDAALVSPEYTGLLRGFRIERCWETVCVARRPGGCGPTPAPTLNARLVASGD
jgi:hypothetical protein